VSARRAAGALPLLALAALVAAADGGAVAASLEGRAGHLVARLDLQAAFPDDLRRTFGNGLTNVVAIQVALLPRGGDDPAAVFVRVVDLRRDVWDETWGVVVRDPATPGGRRLTVRTWEELRALLADARDVDLGPLEELRAAAWELRARVDVNPVSKELLDRTREFLANPPAGVRGGGTPSRSVLGAIAGALLTRSEEGEALHFHTRPFTAREVAPR
jgi:hypothetical protein